MNILLFAINVTRKPRGNDKIITIANNPRVAPAPLKRAGSTDHAYSKKFINKNCRLYVKKAFLS